MASLRGFTDLPDELVARLKHRDQYQGARYEIAVAAIFARIDCEVSFYGPEVRFEKHPEFIARFRPTDDLVAVEAKIRHRPGVIHRPGELDEDEAAKGDVSRLLREALQQDPGDKAFMVFIDVNSPLTPGVEPFEKRWADDIRAIVDKYDAPSREKPDPMTLLALTNYSYHYQEGIPATGSEHMIMRPEFVRREVNPELLHRLGTAIANYGGIPNIDTDLTLD